MLPAPHQHLILHLHYTHMHSLPTLPLPPITCKLYLYCSTQTFISACPQPSPLQPAPTTTNQPTNQPPLSAIKSTASSRSLIFRLQTTPSPPITPFTPTPNPQLPSLLHPLRTDLSPSTTTYIPIPVRPPCNFRYFLVDKLTIKPCINRSSIRSSVRRRCLLQTYLQNLRAFFSPLFYYYYYFACLSCNYRKPRRCYATPSKTPCTAAFR